MKSLQWCHNGRGCSSNHQPNHCLLNRVLRRRSKKTSKLCVTGLVWGIHRWPVNYPHKGPATRKNAPIWWRHHSWHRRNTSHNLGLLPQSLMQTYSYSIQLFDCAVCYLQYRQPVALNIVGSSIFGPIFVKLHFVTEIKKWYWAMYTITIPFDADSPDAIRFGQKAKGKHRG